MAWSDAVTCAVVCTDAGLHCDLTGIMMQPLHAARAACGLHAALAAWSTASQI
jgi:hypothetical protein